MLAHFGGNIGNAAIGEFLFDDQEARQRHRIILLETTGAEACGPNILLDMTGSWISRVPWEQVHCAYGDSRAVGEMLQQVLAGGRRVG